MPRTSSFETSRNAALSVPIWLRTVVLLFRPEGSVRFLGGLVLSRVIMT